MQRSFSPFELSQILGISEADVYSELRRDHLVIKNANGRSVITEGALQEYLARKGLKGLPENFHPQQLLDPDRRIL